MAEGARVILFTGKGGVGKTTVAAATALRCADAGLRTVMVSTDPAHSLADALDVELGPLAVEVAPNLWGEQLDAQERFEDAWGDIQGWVRDVLAWAGVDGIEADELAVLPGLDEVFGLTDVARYATCGAWDAVVVDCAPTAETLRFLSLPDVLSWYMHRVLPASRRLTRLVGPVVSRVSSVPIAGEAVFSATERLYALLADVRSLLTDSARTTIRLVVNPERMVIAEARRTYTYLSLFGYRTDAVVANRLLPEVVADPWFKAWKETHAEHLAAIEEAFAPVPVLRAELAPDELVGVEALRSFGEVLYGDRVAAAVLHEADGLRVDRDGGGHVLSFPLPGADRDDIDLGRRDGELFVRVGPYRRSVLLPDTLKRRPVVDARLRGGRLSLHFGEPVARG